MYELFWSILTIIVIGGIYIYINYKHLEYIKNTKWEIHKNTTGKALLAQDNPYINPMVNIPREVCEAICADDYGCQGYSFNDSGEDNTSYCLRWPEKTSNFELISNPEWLTKLKKK